jgi:hypothetical protein
MWCRFSSRSVSRFSFNSFLVGALLLSAIFVGACGSEQDCADGSCGELSCSGDEDCAGDTYCGPEFTCIADPCSDVDCERGQCVPETGACESKETCTEASEATDCVAGEQCVAGECLTEEAFCAQLGCERGVCDFERESCVSAVDCEGLDALCAPGFFCNAMDQCVENLCESNQVECPEGSQCRPSVGACETALECATSADCEPGHVCLASSDVDEPGICTLESLACGEGVCVGNLICEYDPETMTAECAEGETCSTALDCLGERQCGGRTCMEPVECVAGAFEPNNSEPEATDFSRAAEARALDATLCGGDSDVYWIDTDWLGGGLVRGTLTLTLEYGPRDAGLGELRVELFEPGATLDDAPVATATSGESGINGFAELSYQVSPISLGRYLVRVSDGGDVMTPGVSYRLAAALRADGAVDACSQPRELLPEQPLASDSTESSSVGLGSTCTALDNPAAEDVYAFELLSAGTVTLTVDPDVDDVSLAVSIRGQCARPDTELACRISSFPAQAEVTALLEPGTYYAIVEAPIGEVGGAYEILMEVEPAACTPKSNYCENAGTAQICTSGGWGFEETNCIAGCNPRTGRCFRPRGDQCSNPLVAGDDFSAFFEWEDFRDDYPGWIGGCVPTRPGSAPSDGADAVWQVEVPARHALNATLTTPFGEDGSLYIFEGCGREGNSCLTGVNAGDVMEETLHWVNESDAARTIFLVADRELDGAQTEAKIEINVDPAVCKVGAMQCNGDDLMACNPQQTAYEFERTCQFGCRDGACASPPSDVCSGAEPLSSGVAASGDIGLFNADHGYDSYSLSCFGSWAAGPEAVYSITTTQPNQIVDIELTAPYDALVYVSRSCVAGPPRCFAGVDAEQTGRETLSFVAAEPDTYYIYADADSPGVTGSFTIEATVRTPSCVPGQAIACDAGSLRYCDASGNVDSYICRGGCAAAACQAPIGRRCFDPILLRDGDVVQNTLDGMNRIELGSAQTGRCIVRNGASTRGEENIYRVDLNAGDLLTVEIVSDSPYLIPFISESCVGAVQTCQTIDSNGGDGVLRYYADEARSVYVIVDASRSNHDSYTLRTRIAQGTACAPGAFECLDDTTLQMCSHDGAGYVGQFQCAAGCGDGACLPQADADFCASAPSLGSVVAPNVGTGIVVHGDFGELSDDVTITSASQCVSESGDGPDMIYSVDLRAGDVLQATLSVAGAAQPMLYVLENCAAPDSTCLAGAEYESGDIVGREASIQYVSDVARTVYVVADSLDTNSAGPFTLEIAVTQRECVAPQRTCLDADTMQYCEGGLLKQRGCYYGPCSAGSCPAASHDSCFAATLVPSDGLVHSYRGLMQDFSDSVDLRDGQFYCGGPFNGTPGADAFYAVNLDVGDILDVSWDSPGYGVVWLSSDCRNAANTCATAADSGDPVTFSYKAVTAGTYYIVADNYRTDMDEGEFRIDIQVREPECQLGQTQCADASTLQVCSPSYGLWVDVTCHFGCDQTAGACNPTPNDTCSTATVAPADGAWHAFGAPMSEYGNWAELPAGQVCGEASQTDTDGPEAYFAVDLQAGDVVQAEWSGGSRGTVWIADQCVDISNQCVDGEVYPDPATLVHVAPSAGRYYIVGDTAGPYGSDDMTMRIRAGAPQCDPATYSPTCLDAQRMQTCAPFGLYEPLNCVMGCDSSLGRCACGPTTVARDGDIILDEHVGTNRLDPAMAPEVGSCDFIGMQTRGVDHIYEIELLSGQTLTATYQGGPKGGTSTALLYLLNTCYDESSCLSNTDPGFGGALQYTATQDETVYLVLDSGLNASSASFDYRLAVDIQ